MQITANEISNVEDIGTMDGFPVKLITTKGGFKIAVGRVRGKSQEEALTAGSHGAVVRYNLLKQYPSFQENLMKSENFTDSDATVEKHSHFLSEDLRKSGHDIYSVQKNCDIKFHITKYGIEVGTIVGHLQEDSLVIDKMVAPKEFSRALAGATAEKALGCGAKTLKIEPK